MKASWLVGIVIAALAGCGSSETKPVGGPTSTGSGSGSAAPAKKTFTMKESCEHVCSCIVRPQSGLSATSIARSKQNCIDACNDTNAGQPAPPQACIDCIGSATCDQIRGDESPCQKECPQPTSGTGSSD